MEQYIMIVVFAPIFLGTMGYHAFSIANYIKMLRLAQPEEIKTPLFERIKNVIVYVAMQKKLMKHPVRGFFHVLIFYGFLVYGAHTTSQFIGGFMGDYDFYLPVFLGDTALHAYDYALDVFSLLVLAGLFFFAFRRWVAKAPELDRPSGQSAVVIFLTSTLMITTLIASGAIQWLAAKHGLEVAAHGSPIRVFVADIFTGLKLSEGSVVFLKKFGWWGHIVSVLTFMAFLPNSKHAHLIWAPINYFFHKDTPKGAIPFLDTENAPVWGSANIQDFTWKNMVDGLSCIECGRCTIQCPANRTGKVLNPKGIMNDIKHAVMDQMPKYMKGKKEGKSDEELAGIADLRVIDNYTSPEALWACTTCYACVEACPVGNNQVEAIIAMRRSLVLNEGALPNELQGALTNIENQSNPWGVGAHKREEWAEGMNIKTMAQWKETGETPDVLFWVGCAGAFDDRNKKIVQSFANVLKKADVKFGILGTEENCTGDSARRAGNEYLYQMLAQQNIETLDGYDVKEIVTACPHCFNTLDGEYPQMGGNYNVKHQSTYMADLLSEGKLEVDSDAAKEIGKATYHDSCYLGRYNDNYGDARGTIFAATGQSVAEPIDHHENSLCCGAGGAQMWKEEENGNDRVNLKRTRQLLDTKADTIATACPFCVTMIQDGVKAQEKTEQVNIFDIAEVVDQATS